MTRALLQIGAVGVLSAAAALALHRVEPGAFDFIALYASARLVATGHGADVTDPGAILAAEHEAAPQRSAYLNNPNLPVVSLLLSPLGRLPFDAAYVVFLGGAVAALAAAAVLLAAPRRSLGVAAVALLAPSSILALAQGQTTPFVLAALLVAERVGPLGGGLLLSSAVLRPQLLPLVAVVALRDRRRLLPFAAGAAALLAASVAVAGTTGMSRYPRLLALAVGELGNDEVGLGPLVARTPLVRATSEPAMASVAISALVLLVGAVVVWRVGRGGALAAAGTWSLLGGAHALLHDLLFAYPAVARLSAGRAALLAALGTGCLVAQLGGIPVVPLWLVAVAATAASAGPSSDRLPATR